MRPAGASVALAVCLGVALPADAQTTDDADLIPKSIQGAAAAPTSGETSDQTPPQTSPQTSPQTFPHASDHSALLPGGTGRLYAEDAFTFASVRNDLLVPLPPPPPSDWENRSSVDLNEQWNLGQRVTALLSDRFNVTENGQIPLPSSQMLRNDLREASLSWEVYTRTYLEVGRVNLKDGVALGFNPTDFFRSRTLLDQASLDPSVLRQDRLGTFMLRGEAIWNGGSASLAFAPKLDHTSPLTESTPYGLNPQFGRTNSDARVLGSISVQLASLSPQALVFHEGNQTLIGVNFSRSLGQRWVAYAEWAGGNQQPLAAQALAFGLRTGALSASAAALGSAPGSAPTPTPTPTPTLALTPIVGSAAFRFQSDLAIGGSWTGSAKLTINLEYHYHQAGFAGADERRWFADGVAQPDDPMIDGELWYVRAFANDQQQPWARQHLFLRADWSDAFVPHLELSGFAFVNLYEGSTLTQLAGNYYLSDAWTLGAYASASLGNARSEYGSAPQAAGIILQLQRYF